MNRAAWTKVTIIMLIGASAAACGGSAKPPVPRAMPTSASSRHQETANDAVLAAYRGMWADYSKDLLTANWQDPTSAHHATGEALLSLENQLAVDGHSGWIGKGDPVLNPVVKSITPGSSSSAEVVDCADFSHALTYVAATGLLKDDVPGGWHLIDAGLVEKDGTWKVSTLAVGLAGSC